MKSHTRYFTHHTRQRRKLLRVTDDVAQVLAESGVQEGMVLVSAMHITAGVFVNDWEDGLLHDFDYERWPNPPDHPLQGAAILKERGYSDEIIYAIKSHASYLTDCPRVSLLDKALFACDELSGFLVACALVTPEKKLALVEVASVRKKMKNAGFARAVNRDDIVNGAAELGVDLDTHIAFVREAMLTIAPPLAVLIIAGMACLDSRNIVSTLTCMTRRNSSGFSSTTLPRLPMPILLSRKSSRPQ